MKSRGHFAISMIKSAVRLATCLLAILCAIDLSSKAMIVLFAVGFGGAEILGLLEEFVDKRG